MSRICSDLACDVRAVIYCTAAWIAYLAEHAGWAIFFAVFGLLWLLVR